MKFVVAVLVHTRPKNQLYSSAHAHLAQKSICRSLKQWAEQQRDQTMFHISGRRVFFLISPTLLTISSYTRK